MSDAFFSAPKLSTFERKTQHNDGEKKNPLQATLYCGSGSLFGLLNISRRRSELF